MPSRLSTPFHSITAELTWIERPRGFPGAAKPPKDWIAGMQKCALVLEAHDTRPIAGTQLTLERSESIHAGSRRATCTAAGGLPHLVATRGVSCCASPNRKEISKSRLRPRPHHIFLKNSWAIRSSIFEPRWTPFAPLPGAAVPRYFLVSRRRASKMVMQINRERVTHRVSLKQCVLLASSDGFGSSDLGGQYRQITEGNGSPL